jgi:hypothetical protein
MGNLNPAHALAKTYSDIECFMANHPCNGPLMGAPQDHNAAAAAAAAMPAGYNSLDHTTAATAAAADIEAGMQGPIATAPAGKTRKKPAAGGAKGGNKPVSRRGKGEPIMKLKPGNCDFCGSTLACLVSCDPAEAS